MKEKLTKEDCINLLNNKFQELNRLPKKSDFSVEEVAMIKSFLGPWPRALEEAGVKEVSNGRIDRIEMIEKKKIRTKLREREQKIQNRNSN